MTEHDIEETADLKDRLGDEKLTVKIVARYFQKNPGNTWRVVSGQKPFEQMTEQEKLDEVRQYLREDIAKAAKEMTSGRAEDYIATRALDPLDPVNEFYAEILRRLEWTVEAGRWAKPPGTS